MEIELQPTCVVTVADEEHDPSPAILGAQSDCLCYQLISA
jgi:hypothetical protein